MALQRIHDLVSRQHATGALRQHHQQLELMAGQVARLTVEPGNTSTDVDLQPAETQNFVARRLRRGTAQQRLDACQQLARLERFGQVVVGTELQTDDSVQRLAARCQHQQGHAAGALIGAQLAAQVETIAIGQHQIEQHGIERCGSQRGATLRQRRRQFDLEPGRTQIVAHHRRQANVVIDHQ